MIDGKHRAFRLGVTCASLAMIAMPIMSTPVFAQASPTAGTLSGRVELALDLKNNFEAMALSAKCGGLSDFGNIALRIGRAEILAKFVVALDEMRANSEYDDAVNAGADARIRVTCSDATKAALRLKQEDGIIELSGRALMAQRAAKALPWAAGLIRPDGLEAAANTLVAQFAGGPRKADIQAAADRAAGEVQNVLAIICPQRPKLPNGQARACPAMDANAMKLRDIAQTWLIGAEMLPAMVVAISQKKAPTVTLPGDGYARYLRWGHPLAQNWETKGFARCEFGDPVIAIAPAASLKDLSGQTRALIRFGDGAPIGQVTLEVNSLGSAKPTAADASGVAAGLEVTPERGIFSDRRGRFVRCA
jgi:hypothetical protein